MKKLLLFSFLMLCLNLNAQIVRSEDTVKPDKEICIGVGNYCSTWFKDLVYFTFPDNSFTEIKVQWYYTLKKSELDEIYSEIDRVFALSEFPKGTSFEFTNFEGKKITIIFHKSGYKGVSFVNHVNVAPTIGNPKGIVTQLTDKLNRRQVDKLFGKEK